LKKGWLVINEMMKSTRFEATYQMLCVAAKSRGLILDLYTNATLTSMICMDDCCEIRIAMETPDFVLFWDKDVTLAKLLEQAGIRLFNGAESIRICDNKALTMLALANQNIKCPKTFISPLVFDPKIETPEKFWNGVLRELSFPFIIKECYGSFGEQVYLIDHEDMLFRVSNNMKNRPFLAQEYVESSKGRDVRIYVVKGRIVASILRVNNKDYRANYGADTLATPYKPEEAFLTMALRVADLLGLDFGGIDLMFGKQGEPVFCEANSNAQFSKLSQATGIDIADAIMDMIVEE